MPSTERRPRSAILKLLASLTDPASSATALLVYAKTLIATKESYAIDSSGVVTQGLPYFMLSKTTMYVSDDFISNGTTTFSSSGTGANTNTTVVQNAPGIITQNPGATATSNCRAAMLSGTMLSGTAAIYFEARCRTSNAQDGTDQWTDMWGPGDAAAGVDNTDGVYFQSDRAAFGDNNVRLCGANGGTRTKTSMGVAPTPNTFERWKLIFNAAGTSLQGYLNDVATGSAVTSNLPTGTAAYGAWNAQVTRNAGANSRFVDRDYVECYQIFSPTTR